MVGDIFQPTHLLFVLVVALLVLGPKRLPEVGRTLGSGIRDFRQALSGETPDPPEHHVEQVTNAEPVAEWAPEPASEADIDSSWHVGSIESDEPADQFAAPPEPRAEADTELHGETQLHGDTALHGDDGDRPGATAEAEFEASQRELARQTAESARSAGSSADSHD